MSRHSVDNRDVDEFPFTAAGLAIIHLRKTMMHLLSNEVHTDPRPPLSVRYHCEEIIPRCGGINSNPD